MPHTRERPKKENQWQLDRENQGPVRSDAAAQTAAGMLAQALDQYQGEQYGRTDDGTPRGPPPTEHFAALTAKGQERKREKHSAQAIEHWRNRIAPALLQQIRQAIIPLEVEFRRRLARQREADKSAAEAERRQISAQQTRAPSRTHEWDWD